MKTILSHLSGIGQIIYARDPRQTGIILRQCEIFTDDLLYHHFIINVRNNYFYCKHNCYTD